MTSRVPRWLWKQRHPHMTKLGRQIRSDLRKSYIEEMNLALFGTSEPKFVGIMQTALRKEQGR